jgi:methylated-DNA-protein-cysteine methyltransferase related protein
MADLQVISRYSGRAIRVLEHMFWLAAQPARLPAIRYNRRAVSSFPESVYAIVCDVPPGRVITYGAIARLLGDPRKAREVGWAMAATPEREPPIPAHRVINMRGELSGAFHGSALRRTLLEEEGVRFLGDGRVDLDRHLWLPDEAGSRQMSS